ncbi:MAG: HPP family protein [Candidatus Marsarchaeota archaeon]|nr:HPP family protein [Candidatus Marsarchaeota archaeon]
MRGKMNAEYRYREPKSVKEAAKRLKHRIVPALLAGLVLALLVFMLQYFNIDRAYGLGTTAVIFTSFASSIYIMFIMPNSRAARNSKFVKSYIIAGIIGYIGGLGLAYLPLYAIVAVVLFVVSLLMIITKSEHPPAAAIAFAFVLFHMGYLGIIIIASGVIIVVVLRYLLEKTIFEIEREMLKSELRRKAAKSALSSSAHHNKAKPGVKRVKR